MRRISVAILGFIFVLHTSPVLAALITFNYQGEEWDHPHLDGEFYEEWHESVFLPYVDAERASGFVTIDSSMLPGGSIADRSFSFQGANEISDPVLVDFHFTDHVFSYGLDYVVFYFLNFMTNARGDISVWDITLLTGPSPMDMSLSSIRGDGVGGDAPFYISSSRPGTWTQVPAPGTLALLGLGLAPLVFLRRRRTG